MRYVNRLAMLSVAVLGMTLMVAGCGSEGTSSTPAPTPAATKSLYERLGGEPAITKVVDDFVALAAPDPKVNFTRKGTSMVWDASPANVAKLKKHLVQFIEFATGGPQKYEGRAMKPVHQGMGITDAEFGAIAADLGAALDKNGVPAKEKGELITIVASTKADIVEKK